MPTELINYIAGLPPVSQNNSREIVRSTWNNLRRKYPETRGGDAMVAKIMNSRFGLGLEADYLEKDYGGEPKL